MIPRTIRMGQRVAYELRSMDVTQESDPSTLWDALETAVERALEAEDALEELREEAGT